MKNINFIFGVFLIVIGITMKIMGRGFSSNITIMSMIVISLVIIMLNIINCLKSYRNDNKEEVIMSGCMIFICLLCIILGGLSIYNEINYSEIFRLLEEINTN